jgi:hypothetical protein
MKVDINWVVLATIIGPLLAAAAAVALDRWLERRPKLISWLGHASAVRMPPAQPQGQPYDIYTHTVVVRNAGRRSANNMRLGHFHLPNFSVFPAVAHRVENVPGGGSEIIFPTLVPSEQVTITYLYFPPVTYNQINSYAKSDEGMARIITMLPTPMQPMWLLRTAAVVLLLGVVMALYLLVLFALWVVRLTSG